MITWVQFFGGLPLPLEFGRAVGLNVAVATNPILSILRYVDTSMQMIYIPFHFSTKHLNTTQCKLLIAID